MSTMSNIATCVELAFESFGDEVPPLVHQMNIHKLRSAYESQEGETNWFNKSTLEFFGSANLRIELPGITVEQQLEAPDTVDPWSVTAWVIWPDTGRISPRFLDRFETESEAVLFAETIYDEWESRVGSN